MSYQVIARKYRPQRFADVVGQEHVTRTLQNAIQHNRIAHAYLFVGPRGTGKTTIARIFAKCLNCTGGPKTDFSDDDPRCQEIAEGRSLDVLEIDGASNRGIEEIRELRETVKYTPATSKFKIYIIDEVHMLTKEAFNALLKTLEEPPAHVKFMFATTEPEKVLPTILSRCQRFDLRRIPVPKISSHLAHIATLEKVTIDEPALHAIARGAEGGMRDAESALDQLISFCGQTITEPDVLSMFGLTARDQILALAAAILEGQPQAVLELLNQLASQGKDLGRLLSEMLSHFRNLLLFQVARGNSEMLEVSEAEAAALRNQAPLANADTLTRILEILTDAEGRYRDAASKKIFLEVTLLRALQARQTIPIDAVLTELRAMRGDSASVASRPARSSARTPGPASTPAPTSPRAHTPSTVSTPAAPSQSTVASSDATMAHDQSLDSLWQQLLEAVGRASAFTRTYLVEARPVSLANGVFTFGFDPEFSDQAELVNNQRVLTLLQTKLQELGHPKLQVKLVVAEAPAGRGNASAVAAPNDPAQADSPTPTPLPTPQNPKSTPAPKPVESKPTRPGKAVPEKVSMDEFKNDPLIQKALEIFKGQIVEVRA